jgi:protein phosphatase
MLTSALGVNRELDIQIVDPQARPGDMFLLCSDGLTARLDDDDLGRIIGRSTGDPGPAPDSRSGAHDLARTARTLVDAANDAGGPDNVTVALLQVLAQEPAGT